MQLLDVESEKVIRKLEKEADVSSTYIRALSP